MLYYWQSLGFVKCSSPSRPNLRFVDRTLPQILKALESHVCELPLSLPVERDADDGPATATARPGATLLQLVQAAERHAGSVAIELPRALAQARALASAPACPIIAIVGMLNAGKSSLVATFLGARQGPNASSSPAPDSRVLIGSANHEGTHRFVLWLPESWKTNPEVWNFVHMQLQAVFGTECEFLADDPKRAAAQYNDVAPRPMLDPEGNRHLRNPIEVPLVATDPSLDRLGIALMDCPDVQTGLLRGGREVTQAYLRFEEASASIADARFDVLTRAATLCSAFVLVLPANALHDQTVSKLLRLLEQRMPHVQRIMAVNRVPRKYGIDEIAREVAQLYRSSNLRRVYMAYHFDGPLNRERIPQPPIELRYDSDPPLPLFFRVDSESAAQPPESIPDEDWLIRLGRQLQANNLLADAIRSTNARLANTLHRALEIARIHVEEQHRNLQYLHRVVADACTDFSIDPHSPATTPRIRLQASRWIIQQIADSLERTAPWWARPGRWVQRIAQAGKSTVTGAVTWMRMPTWISDSTRSVSDWVRARIKRGESGSVVTADSLCDHLAERDARGLLGIDDAEATRSRIRDACQRAIERFQNESATRLDPEQIDALTRRVWADMPMRQRWVSGIAPAGILFAPLLAVIMVPLDFGGSTVLVFASLKELLFAGAAGVGLVLASADAMPYLAESESAWQQLSDLIAVLTDELGLDRPSKDFPTRIALGGSERWPSPSTIAPHRNPLSDLPGSHMRPMVVDEARVGTIVELLESMEQAQRT
jgi:hypothetical protein